MTFADSRDAAKHDGARPFFHAHMQGYRSLPPGIVRNSVASREVTVRLVHSPQDVRGLDDKPAALCIFGAPPRRFGMSAQPLRQVHGPDDGFEEQKRFRAP